MTVFCTSLSRFLIATSLLTIVTSASALARTSFDPSGEQTEKKEAPKISDQAQKTEPLPTKLSDIELAPIEGYKDETTYQEAQADYAEELAEQARQASDLTKQADLWLVAANLTLAHSLEPACTRVLLRLPAKRRTDKSVSQLLEAVDEYLGQASSIIAELKESQPTTDVTWIAQSTKKVRILKAFSAAMRAIILYDQADDVTRAMRSAASDLAIWMEDDDEQIAAAAVLWHAALRGHEFKLSPSMQVLPLATEELSRRTLPFAFFSRLLRCVILADHSRYAASMALLTKMEDHCESWFTNDIDRADSLRAVSVVETEVLRLWRDSLTEPSNHKARQWCDEKLADIFENRFQQTSHTVLRLRPAVPLITSIADLQQRQPEETP